ncbi:MAG TPA: hypothetical protein VGL72_18715 [Bryobacteraceae bacterium]|jgi:hypothetical protein
MTAAAKGAKRSLKIRQPRNTLQNLWRCLFLIWALDVALLITALIGSGVHRDAMKAVAVDSAPSIIAAQEIKYELADMDANAANELLGEANQEAYDKQRNGAATSLIKAAKNITYEGEEGKITDIQTNLGLYEIQIQRARDLAERKDKLYVNAYRDAAATMDTKLLKSADELDKINDRELKGAYESLKSHSGITNFGILAAGVALLAVLISVQKFLNDRTHRVLNPLLVAATLIALSFLGYTISRLDAESRHLKVVKKDAFDSMSALLRARAIAYAANADESRFLLDRDHANQYDAAFFDKSAQLARLPSGMNYNSVAASEERRRKVSGFRGLLADELHNITFADEGEGQKAAETLRQWGRYVDVDQRIRDYEKDGNHAAAIKLCVGESNQVFDDFNSALKATFDVNDAAFKANRDAGFEALSNFEAKAVGVAIVIALLGYFGLLPRIREYQ